MLSLFKSFPYGEICFQFFSNVNETTVNTAEFTVIHTLCVFLSMNISVGVLSSKVKWPLKGCIPNYILIKNMFRKHTKLEIRK